MTGARGWRSDYGRTSQHLLAVRFPVFCGCGLKLEGILLHAGELFRDGLDGSRLLVGRLNHDRGLQTRGPGCGLVRDLWRVWLVVAVAVGCIWRGADLVTLVGCLVTPVPALAATSVPLGRRWWRQGGGPSGLTGDPPGGWRPSRMERTAVVQRRRVVPFAVVAVVQLYK